MKKRLYIHKIFMPYKEHYLMVGVKEEENVYKVILAEIYYYGEKYSYRSFGTNHIATTTDKCIHEIDQIVRQTDNDIFIDIYLNKKYDKLQEIFND